MSIIITGGPTPHPGPWPTHFTEMDKCSLSRVFVAEENLECWIPLNWKAKVWDPNDSASKQAARYYIFGWPSQEIKAQLKAADSGLEQAIKEVVQEYFNMNRASTPQLEQTLKMRLLIEPTNGSKTHWLVNAIGMNHLKRFQMCATSHWGKIVISSIAYVALLGLYLSKS